MLFLFFSLQDSDFGRRVRYCKICKGYIKGFDHHCPAFGNCIGTDNEILAFSTSFISYLTPLY